MSKAIDLTGQRFGKLKVIRCLGKDKSQNRIWECLCDCGNTTIVCGRNLMSRHTNSCGCLFGATVSAESKKKAQEKVSQKYCKSGTKLYNLTQSTAKNNVTGVKGVYYHEKTRKYVATIRFRKTLHTLGRYDTLEAAAKARALAEEQYFQPILDKYKDENSTHLKCDLLEG